ncbi:MAG: hypothetical protein ACRBB6_10280 [Neptuniibacter sp.]
MLTAQKKIFDEPLDLNLEKLAGVKVVEIQHGNKLSSQSGVFSRPTILKRLKKIVKFVLKGFGATFDPRNSWFKATAAIIPDIVKETDIVVSTYGPVSAHLIAAEMKKISPNIKWIADYRDPWSQNFRVYTKAYQRAKAEKLELSVVGQLADEITTVSGNLAVSLGVLLSKEVHVVTNGFDISEGALEENLNREKKYGSKPLKITYTGMIYPEYQDPRPLLIAISQLELEGVIQAGDILVEFFGASDEYAQSLLKDNAHSSFISIKGHVPREKALQAQVDSGLLLLLESSKPEAVGVLTGKVFEYISSGVPVLSLGSGRNSAIYQLLNETHTGFCAENDVNMIKNVLVDLLNGSRPEWFSPDVEVIRKYSRKSQAELFFKKLIC